MKDNTNLIVGAVAGLSALWYFFFRPGARAAAGVAATSSGPVLTMEPHTSTPPVIPAAQGPGYVPAGGILIGSGLPLPSMVEHPKRDPYIDQLWAREQIWKPQARTHYNINNLRRIARAASAYYGVPPSWTWGLIRGESDFWPVGIYAHSPAKAKAIKSNAYGMGQLLRSRFDKSEKAWINQSSNGYGWNHSDMIDPKRAIWTVAASVGRGLKNRGGGPAKSLAKQQAAIKKMALSNSGLLVGKWWAGFSSAYEAGARKKIRDVRRYGPDVYSTGPPPSSAMYQRLGPTIGADDLPPWMVGSLTPAAAAALSKSNVALEQAGSFLADPDTGVYTAPPGGLEPGVVITSSAEGSFDELFKDAPDLGPLVDLMVEAEAKEAAGSGTPEADPYAGLSLEEQIDKDFEEYGPFPEIDAPADADDDWLW